MVAGPAKDAERAVSTPTGLPSVIAAHLAAPRILEETPNAFALRRLAFPCPWPKPAARLPRSLFTTRQRDGASLPKLGLTGLVGLRILVCGAMVSSGVVR